MAKRRRLNPVQRPIETKEAGSVAPVPAPAPGARPAAGLAPVAQVAGEAAGAGALAEIADYIRRARVDGLLLVSLPLRKIETGHLHRDRIMPADPEADEDMAALIASLRARGQQTPIDVVRIPGDPREHYGLISGMRRVTALRHLHKETGEARFGQVTARVVAGTHGAAAYLAMVEENEIRADISFYERARIAVKAVEAKAFEDVRAALRGLFGNVSRAKRSKIGSFVRVVEALEGHLRHPAALSEKRGLALSKALEADGGLAARLVAALEARGDRSEAEEREILEQALLGEKPAKPAKAEATASRNAGQGAIAVTRRGDRLVLCGPGVDAALHEALLDWLAARE